MSKNICRLDGNQIFLSVLRDDDEAVGLYAKWMSDETTCVFIEHAHSVVDITRMPGWEETILSCGWELSLKRQTH